MSRILITLLCMMAIHVYAQDNSHLLTPIATVEVAREFAKNHPDLNAEVFNVYSKRDTLAIHHQILEKNPGEIFVNGDYAFKIIESSRELAMRAEYLLLDGSKLNKKQIDSIRKVIVKGYKSGMSFHELIKPYIKDNNMGGDLGWFKEGTLAKEFDEAIKKRRKGEIFTADAPSSNWYYVAVKTYDDKYFKKATVISLKNT